MFYGQIPLQKATENQSIVTDILPADINADFISISIAASFIKNYKELKNSVIDKVVLKTNIHVSVTELPCFEAKNCKLMPTIKVFTKNDVA